MALNAYAGNGNFSHNPVYIEKEMLLNQSISFKINSISAKRMYIMGSNHYTRELVTYLLFLVVSKYYIGVTLVYCIKYNTDVNPYVNIVLVTI